MATVAHCFYCFDVLTSHLERRRPMPLAGVEELCAKRKLPAKFTTNGEEKHSPCIAAATTALSQTPLFITWKMRSASGRLDLRGCIGTFDPKPLETGLKDYALTAALHDTRFDPIALRELPRLECGVTLLTDFEPASNPMDWTIGIHGLQIDFIYHNRRMGATYLPDVPAEQGWTKEETLVSLMKKAGWTGRRDTWRSVDLKVTRYQGSKATVSWMEYQELVLGLVEVTDDDEAEEETDGEDEKVMTNGTH